MKPKRMIAIMTSLAMTSACSSSSSSTDPAPPEIATAAAESALQGRARHQLEAEVERVIDEGLTPSVSVGIMRRGRPIYTKGFGQMNLESQTDASPQSIYLIGSITKQFTAAAIVQLSEQAKLTIEDPISMYFPDFPRGSEVRIRHLLGHTSGIRPIATPSSPPTPAQAVLLRNTADVIAFIQSLPNLYTFDPGTAREYTNSGYWLLGAIVEKVSGLSLRDYMQQNLFIPAEMTTAALDDAREVVPGRAAGYVHARATEAAPREGGDSSPSGTIFDNPAPGYLQVTGGAGGIRASVHDMLRWQDALFHERIVSAEGLALMQTRGTLDNGEPLPGGFGMSGGNKNGHPFYSASGGTTEGFTATITAFPDDEIAYVVLTNIGPKPDAMKRISDTLDDMITGAGL